MLLLLATADAAGPASPIFREVPPGESGITWVHTNGKSIHRYLPETSGAGVAIFDFDNDGWMDILLVDSGTSSFYKPEKPLHPVLVGTRLKPNQFRHTPIQLTDRIRIENLVFQHEPVPFPAPFAPAAQITFPIERDHDSRFERRRQVGCRCVRRMVVNRNDACLREQPQGDR